MKRFMFVIMVLALFGATDLNADEQQHVVQSGDSIRSIAEQHGLTPKQLRQCNPPDIFYLKGRTLWVTAPTQKGEKPSVFAKRCGITLSQLRQYNPQLTSKEWRSGKVRVWLASPDKRHVQKLSPAPATKPAPANKSKKRFFSKAFDKVRSGVYSATSAASEQGKRTGRLLKDNLSLRNPTIWAGYLHGPSASGAFQGGEVELTLRRPDMDLLLTADTFQGEGQRGYTLGTADFYLGPKFRLKSSEMHLQFGQHVPLSRDEGDKSATSKGRISFRAKAALGIPNEIWAVVDRDFQVEKTTLDLSILFNLHRRDKMEVQAGPYIHFAEEDDFDQTKLGAEIRTKFNAAKDKFYGGSGLFVRPTVVDGKSGTNSFDGSELLFGFWKSF